MPSETLRLLQELVRIPSVNPDNHPGTLLTGEAALLDFLKPLLEQNGAHVELEEVLPGRANLIARWAPLDGRPRILLGPHSDTVGVGGMTISPFGAEIRDGRLWGRGASDTKGPMAAMLHGLFAHRTALADAPVAIDFVAFASEESLQWGSRHFANHHASEYRFAIVGEPTQMQAVHVTKGSLWTGLRATGVAAHSSQPQLGKNAVMKLAAQLCQLIPALDARLAAYSHPVLGRSTINVGVFQGGSRPNIVPDLAEAQIDIRLTPDLSAVGGALQLLTATLADLNLGLELIRPHENAPMETDPHHPVLTAIRNIAPSIGLAGAPWFSDAAHLAAVGLPAICLGPGSIDQAHTADEWISIADLDAGANLFAALVGGLSQLDPTALAGD